MRRMMLAVACLGLASSAFAQDYDFLLKGGHVIDARNKLSAVRDVAIKDGKIAAVAADIPAARALKTVDVSGMYVTPGLIDLHAHVYRPTVGVEFGAANNAVIPDGFSFRSGVTTFVDPGGSRSCSRNISDPATSTRTCTAAIEASRIVRRSDRVRR
jgi:dihydroorotase